MRKLLAFLFIIAAVGVWAQEAPLSTPITRSSETKVKIRVFTVTNLQGLPATGSIQLSVQDAANIETRATGVDLPGTSPCNGTVPGLNTAMITVRAGETGNDSRKIQYRILGYLFDQGCLPGFTAPTP